MKKDNIHFEHIKVKDLREFAERVLGAAEKGQFIPITMQRAVAHANNPYAAKDDIGLLVAIDAHDEIVGYFGILPLLLRRDEEYFKVNWFTTWSVSPTVRGRGVGSRLMSEALSLNQDYLIVGSVHARRVCRKHGFLEREPLLYYWLDASGMGHLNPIVWLRRAGRKMLHFVRLDKKIKIKINSPFTDSLDRWIAPVTKRFFYARLMAAQTQLLAGIRFREVEQLRGNPPTYPHRPDIELHRGVDAINWMLQHPWIVETGKSISEEMEYYFSDARPLYRLIALEVYSPEDEYVGFVVFSVTRKKQKIMLKTLDFRFVNPSDNRYALALAIHYGRRYQADTIELPQEVADYVRDSLLGRLLLHRKKRIYQCMPADEDSPLAQAWDDISLHLSDGDMAFS